ncbi:MAG TPA: hypothetical protein VNQ79_24835 [Blastocatellia bacterium]|nr:hypothetical protein [Blastocatellia bacterium]
MQIKPGVSGRKATASEFKLAAGSQIINIHRPERRDIGFGRITEHREMERG